MTLFFYSFEIISVVMPDPKFFFWITSFVADAVALNPNGIKALVANGFNTFFSLKGNLFLLIIQKDYLKIVELAVAKLN